MELFHSHHSQEETLICRLASIRIYKGSLVIVGEGEEAELLRAVLLRLGHYSLPPTNLGRVDEEMASPGGRPNSHDKTGKDKRTKSDCDFSLPIEEKENEK
ncbi:hypothetical protein TNCV_4702511 [Trichonephila clavipes]|nr:hypothetical protein TNCV_4702511 [Trichonephila clavipes]